MSWFNELFSSPGGFPANGGVNLGYFSSADVDETIGRAPSQTDRGARRRVLGEGRPAGDAGGAIYPITEPLQLAEHAPYVHNAVYMIPFLNFDPANVWLSKPGS